MIKGIILEIKNKLQDIWPFILAGVLWGGQSLSFADIQHSLVSPFDLTLGALFLVLATYYYLWRGQKNSLPFFKLSRKKYFFIFIFWIISFLLLSLFSYHLFWLGSGLKIVLRLLGAKEIMVKTFLNPPGIIVGYLWPAFFLLGLALSWFWQKILGQTINIWKSGLFLALIALFAPLAGLCASYLLGTTMANNIICFAILGASLAPFSKNELNEDEV